MQNSKANSRTNNQQPKTKQNGQDKKSESESPAISTKQERRNDNEIRIEVGESGTSSN
jgi:desulfoferrodoxin (superoxide reductase-like protein)